MIDYAVLCQTIAEWKAGQRPSSSGVYQQTVNPEEVEEVGSGLVVMDDESAMTYEEMPPQRGGYEEEGEATYGDEQAAEPVYEDAGDEDLLVDTDDED